MKDEDWIRVFKDLATGLVRMIPSLLGIPPTVLPVIPIGTIITLFKLYQEHFGDNPFKVSISKIHGEIARCTEACNELRDELEHVRNLLEKVRRGEIKGNAELLEAKAKQLEDELEITEDKNIILNLALIVRDRNQLEITEFLFIKL